MRNQLIVGLAHSSNKPPAEVQPIVDELLMPDFTSHARELGDSIVDLWASSFTIEELHALHSFYTTPVGEKLLKTAPVIGQQIAKDSAGLGAGRVAEDHSGPWRRAARARPDAAGGGCATERAMTGGGQELRPWTPPRAEGRLAGPGPSPAFLPFAPAAQGWRLSAPVS